MFDRLFISAIVVLGLTLPANSQVSMADVRPEDGYYYKVVNKTDELVVVVAGTIPMHIHPDSWEVSVYHDVKPVVSRINPWGSIFWNTTEDKFSSCDSSLAMVFEEVHLVGKDESNMSCHWKNYRTQLH